MRMGFNGLQGAVVEKLEANVPDGTMFVFTKKGEPSRKSFILTAPACGS